MHEWPPAAIAALSMLFVLLIFEAPADSIYGDVRRQLEQAGQPIGGNDLLIAAHAIALGCTVVTDKQREFGWHVIGSKTRRR